MASLDLIVDKEITTQLGITSGELSDLARQFGVHTVALRSFDVRFYQWADYLTFKAHLAQALADERRPTATVTNIGARSKVDIRATLKAVEKDHAQARRGRARVNVRKADTVEPYPIDPETEVEELSEVSKLKLTAMALELGIPDAAKRRARADIAYAIVEEKQRQWAIAHEPPPKPEDEAIAELSGMPKRRLVQLAESMKVPGDESELTRSEILKIPASELARMIVLEQARRWYANHPDAVPAMQS